jgi:hypothetical protein
VSAWDIKEVAEGEELGTNGLQFARICLEVFNRNPSRV